MDILKYEKTYQSRGYNNIVGIDEAGRGPLAGPVVAVSLNWGESPIIEGVKDSKKISEKKRLKLFDMIMQNALDIGIGIVHEKKIDEINVLQATYLAMKISIGKLKIKPDILLIDGKRADIHHIEQKNIIKGDSLSYSIAAASIIAKVTRDKLMLEYSKIYPEYNFEKHKGYGTKFHIDTIKEKKSCPIHRKSFKPINSYLPTIKDYKKNNNLTLLGKQLVASYLIKKNYKIIIFNDGYDLILRKDNLIIIANIHVLFNNKTINSKIPSNKLNFDTDMKDFLSTLKTDLNQCRLDSITINLIKSDSQIVIKEGLINEFC